MACARTGGSAGGQSRPYVRGGTRGRNFRGRKTAQSMYARDCRDRSGRTPARGGVAAAVSDHGSYIRTLSASDGAEVARSKEEGPLRAAFRRWTGVACSEGSIRPRRGAALARAPRGWERAPKLIAAANGGAPQPRVPRPDTESFSGALAEDDCYPSSTPRTNQSTGIRSRRKQATVRGGG